MADISVTASSVLPVANSSEYATGIAGEAITAGQPCYLKSSDGKYYKADANDATLENRTVLGISANSASTNQQLNLFIRGTYVAGATLVAGQYYFLSATAGGICPHADLVTVGMKSQRLFYATTTTIAKLDIFNSEIAIA